MGMDAYFYRVEKGTHIDTSENKVEELYFRNHRELHGYLAFLYKEIAGKEYECDDFFQLSSKELYHLWQTMKVNNIWIRNTREERKKIKRLLELSFDYDIYYTSNY